MKCFDDKGHKSLNAFVSRCFWSWQGRSKAKKRQWVYCYHTFVEVETALMFRIFFYLPLKQAHHFEKRIAY